MTASSIASVYSPLEERINVVSHAAGFVFSIVAFVLLVSRAIGLDSTLYLVGFTIFGTSLVILFGASTLYHSALDPLLRSRLRILDHASIYVLIAGTYTPFTLVTLSGPTGWTLFFVSWGFAITGIVLKLFFTGQYRKTSTAMYVLMGWLIVFAIKPLIVNLPPAGLSWLISGGLAYTLGATIYSIARVPFNHAIFHMFVLTGATCHFMVVYFYV
jgi:hemolysin III